MPEIREAERKPGSGFSFRVLRHVHLSWAVIAAFYVGAGLVAAFFALCPLSRWTG